MSAKRDAAKANHLAYMLEIDSTHGATSGALMSVLRELSRIPLPEKARDLVDEGLGVADALEERMAEAWEKRRAATS